jgi:hypothetical protein
MLQMLNGHIATRLLWLYFVEKVRFPARFENLRVMHPAAKEEKEPLVEIAASCRNDRFSQ